MTDSTESANIAESAAWYAALWDRIATAESSYTLAIEFQGELGISLFDDLPDSFPDVGKAAVWAIEYAVELEDASGRGRVSLVPRHRFDDTDVPPQVTDVSESIRDRWIELLAEAKSPAAVARLSHLLFQIGHPRKYEYAKSAIASYISAASNDSEHGLDVFQDLACAVRLASAIKEKSSKEVALNALLDLAENYLTKSEPPAGIVSRALQFATAEADCPSRIDHVLETAAKAWPDSSRNDHAMKLMLRRATDDSQRAAVWERRVDAYLREAERESSAILRITRRQTALQLAIESGLPKLRERAASALQESRKEQLELVHISSTSIRYDEEFNRLRDSFTRGDGWRQALVTFGTYSAISGDVEMNRQIVRNQHQEHPLAFLFPHTIYGADNLPIIIGATGDQAEEISLVRQELYMIGLNLRPFTAAWLEIPDRFGIPDPQELAEFLSSWPGMDKDLVSSLVRSMLRSWAGDGEGAAFTIAPRIEQQVRSLVVNANAGVYRLQRERSPGQYPGLGYLLPIIPRFYDLDESRLRFLTTTLCHAAGFNLRNNMLHGFTDIEGPAEAALLIHCMLMLGALRPHVAVVQDDAKTSPDSETGTE